MKELDFKKAWSAFLHWKGWKITADACVKGWKAAAAWRGWGKLFGLPFWLILLMAVGCGAGLAWIFLNRLDQWWPAYILYALSAYCLAALCIRLPGALRKTADWRRAHPKIDSMLKDEELKFRVELYLQQLINFAYGIFKIASGVIIGSAWIGCDGIYNMAQALIQLFQILRRRKAGTLVQQWKSYRFSGVLILLMHLTLIGIVFQMVNWNRVEDQGEIMIIATAVFAFYKFISSFVKLAKDRKHKHPVDSSVRMLELSQAIFAIFSLQAGMLHTFGTGDAWEYWMNLGVGCVVCLLTVAMGIYMICRANREIKDLQEKQNGE